MEYEEVISSKYNTNVAKNVIRTLLVLPNVYQTTIYYHLNSAIEFNETLKSHCVYWLYSNVYKVKHSLFE